MEGHNLLMTELTEEDWEFMVTGARSPRCRVVVCVFRISNNQPITRGKLNEAVMARTGACFWDAHADYFNRSFSGHVPVFRLQTVKVMRPSSESLLQLFKIVE